MVYKKNKNIYKNAVRSLTGAMLIAATVISTVSSVPLVKQAFAATGDAAEVTIGRVEDATGVDMSVCVRSTSGSFKLADTSTWLSFNPAQLSTTTTLTKTGKFSSTDGYSATVFQDVAQPAGFTNDIWSLRTDFIGDGVTAGQQGLAVSTTMTELIGKTRFTKLAGGSPAVNLDLTNYYSLDYPTAAMAISVVNVAYDCNATPIAQSNISNSSNCISSLNVTVPNVYACNFPLTGNPDNTYTIVTGPIKANTGTDNTTNAILAGSASDDCTITGNGTAAAALNCLNIKSAGGTAGVRNVITTINGLGATDAGDVTLVFSSSTLNLKAFLAGDYNTVTNLMRTNLNIAGIVPSTQPYNVAPFNYAGSETIGGAVGATVVDWVLIEVRNTSNVVVERKAGLLKSDGTIVNASTQSGGIQLTTITTSGTYNVVVRHRNHLAIRTNTGVTLTSGSTVAIDYSTNSNVLGSNQTLLATGVYGMKKGNTNGDANIDASDRTATRLGVETLNIYDKRDLNMDGYVDATDRFVVRTANDATDGI